MKGFSLIALALLGVLSVWYLGLGAQEVFAFTPDWVYYKVRVVVRVTDCRSGAAIDRAEVTVHNDPETYARGYTNSAGTFTKEVGIFLKETENPERGVLKYVEATARKAGYGECQTLRKRVTAVFRSTEGPWLVVLEINLCLSPGNQPPVASFVYSPALPKVGDLVNFDASKSFDPDGRVVGFRWNFGDGTIVPVDGWLSGHAAAHAYKQPGSYTVTLTVLDDQGVTGTTSQVLTVAKRDVGACSVAIQPSQPTTKDQVVITVSGTAGTPCWTLSHRAVVVGNSLNIVGAMIPTGEICIQVVTPWQFIETVGPLPAGVYTVNVNIEGACVAQASFTVITPPQCTVTVPNAFFCQGTLVPITLNNASPSPLGAFVCQIETPSIQPPGTVVVRSYSVPGLPPGGVLTITWDQRDASGRLVSPGLYLVKCGCSGIVLPLLIMDCTIALPWPPHHPSYGIPWPRYTPGVSGPSTTPIGSGTASGRPSCGSVVLFADNFDRPTSGWPSMENVMGYNAELKEYFIAFREPAGPAWVLNQQAGMFGDFCYSVLGQAVEGPDTSFYGLVFRYKDEKNFYCFLINGAGYFAVYKRISGEYVALVEFQPSSAIQLGKGSNVLHVVVKGNRMWFLVNGQELATVTDDAFVSGAIGFYATPGLYVRFDSVEVRGF